MEVRTWASEMAKEVGIYPENNGKSRMVWWRGCSDPICAFGISCWLSWRKALRGGGGAEVGAER